ncbi:MAG: hypothetical protein QOE95_547, partial [Gaiellaceae bacterium]|nr:hypothetical protein [Gaiellaceae bacterium]
MIDPDVLAVLVTLAAAGALAVPGLLRRRRLSIRACVACGRR